MIFLPTATSTQPEKGPGLTQDTRTPHPDQVTGIRHFFAAAGYSISGVRRLWAEAAFRHEVSGGAAILGLLFYLQAPAVEFLIFGALFLLLVAVEALNTAIECIVDHVSPEWAAFARDAKDLGSLGVMCLLLAHGGFLAYVIFA